MPERGFDTGFWTEEYTLEIPYPAKHLLVYLGSNDHCNQAGVYRIGLKTISFESGIPESDLPALFRTLDESVKWLPAESIIWVKDFVHRQAKSPKFLIAAAKCLRKINNNGLAEEVVAYNEQHYTLSIPYRYPIDTLSIPSVTVSSTDTVSGCEKEMRVVKGEEKPKYDGETTPPSESENGESLSAGDQKVISTWFSVKGFSMSLSDASELVARLRTEFPDVDILAESKKWAARKLSEPLTKKTRPSAQVWNWMVNARKFAEERGVQHGEDGTHRGHPAPDTKPPRKPVRYIE